MRQEGFTSMDALILIDRGDLCKANLAIPRGQQKLALAAVQKFVQSKGLAQIAVAQASQEMAGETSQTTDQSNGTDATGQISPNNGVGATIQTSAQVRTAQASGGNEQISTSGCQISEDPYLKALLQQFRAGKGQTNGAYVVIIPNNSDSVNSQLLNGLGIQNNGPEISANSPLLVLE